LKDSISINYIKQSLKSNELLCIILLVNAVKLNGVDINFDYNSDNLSHILSSHQSYYFNRIISTAINFLQSSTYCGHFIVLVGYDEENSVFFYLNPSTSKNLSFTCENDIEISRKDYGTDEDILFVYI
jgi:hypothetical protein